MDIPKAYEPRLYEENVYKEEEESGFFNPDFLKRDALKKNGASEQEAKYFSIVLPPPNVTGTLHIGHATMLAIEDVMARFKRMQGYDTVWIPGLDHAAIATQNVVEKKLKKEKNITRYDLGRENFLKLIEEFVEDSKKTIHRQTRRMGASLDWDREAYTMDAAREKAVNHIFKMMYDDGIIYRGLRVINWCPKCSSTLADDELVYAERPAKLYTFKYSKDFPFAISSTRPETKLGDTAVAVNPKDSRYKKFIGKIFNVEFADGAKGFEGYKLKLRVVEDRGVDINFGTGALGVTPAHSQIDEEIAKNNKLPSKQVINEKGLMHGLSGDGISVEKMRARVVEALRQSGLLEKEEDVKQNVPTCYRCSSVVESLPKEQWFVGVGKPFKFKASKINPIKGVRDGKKVTLKQLMRHVVKTGQIKIVPERFEKIYFNWADNLRDWCISRQIWFGHKVPVKGDPDTLDTWFSAGLWTFSTLGWPCPRIWYVRHGECDSNVNGYYDSDNLPQNVLTEKGKKQAEEAGKFLSDKNLDLIFMSPLKRTMETAKIIAKRTGAKVVVDKRITELYMGEFEGRKWDEWKSERGGRNYKEVGDAFIKKYGAETYGELRKRAYDFLEEINLKHAGKNVAVVSHQAVISQILSYGKNIDEQKAWNIYKHIVRNGAPIPNDLARFHPTSALETGYDILFFWVARMIMMSAYALGEVPFKNVYLHGLVRDRDGDKMSKSKPETMIDPLPVAEKYGTDAVRLSLLIGTSAGNDFKLWEEKIAGFRNFTNKLWNIARFMIMNGASVGADSAILEVRPQTDSDKWILLKLTKTLTVVTKYLEEYEFSKAGEILRDFTWGELADWYLEFSKSEIKSGFDKKLIFSFLLDTVLRLWHPFMPFVTETIWKNAGGRDLLLTAKWPEDFPPRNETEKKDWKAASALFEKWKEKVVEERRKKSETKTGTEAQNGKTKKEIEEKKLYIKILEVALSNKEFVKNAPSAVVNEKKLKLGKAKEELKKLEKHD